MNRLLFPFFALCFSAQIAADAAGNALAQQVRDRPTGKDSFTQGSMVLLEPGRAPRVRKMHTYQLEPRENAQWTMIRFTDPADIADTGLLTLDHASGETDQWVYLPAVRKARRIPSERRGGNFVGSDLIFEDLRDRKVEADEHTIIGEEAIEGQMCKVLQSIPKDKSSSEYSKRVSWVHPQTLVALRAEVYAGGDKPIKRLEVRKLQKIQNYWTVMELAVTDLKSGHSTRMLADSVRYDIGLPEQMFTVNVLEDPLQEASFYTP